MIERHNEYTYIHKCIHGSKHPNVSICSTWHKPGNDFFWILDFEGNHKTDEAQDFKNDSGSFYLTLRQINFCPFCGEDLYLEAKYLEVREALRKEV